MSGYTVWNHPAALPIDELLAACRVERTRGSGPGGQHRNKVETAIRVYHQPSGVVGEASERRAQEANRRAAVSRLRVNLALAVRGSIRESHVPSTLWRTRSRGRKISVSVQHDDFPALLAEALDVLSVHDMQVPLAARDLLISASQLVRFLKLEPRALTMVNARRSELSLRPLR